MEGGREVEGSVWRLRGMANLAEYEAKPKEEDDRED